MKNGLLRFEYYLDQLQELLTKSSLQKNPALWLYMHNARTPLFMLEGLAKLYSGLHNKKKFDKLKDHFKLLEDALGKIDYYDAFAKQFEDDNTVPQSITNYLQAQSLEKIKAFNEILIKKGWLGNNNTRIKKIKKKLAKANWQNEKKEIKNIRAFYVSAINKILEFINQKDFHFIHLENDVHEFRRMIRWLSIYPQALRGSIQLKNTPGNVPAYLTKYLTKEITGSPYNVMPGAGSQKYFLLLDKNRFYALSWLIAELGNLKDSGLKVEVITEALLHTTKTKEAQSLAKVYKLAGADQKSIQALLAAASSLCKTFCKEKNLESLVIATAAVK